MKSRYLTEEELAKVRGRFQTVSFDAVEKPALFVAPEELVSLLSYLKKDKEWQFTHLDNLTAVDWKDTIDMVYHLFSWKNGLRVVVKVKLIHDDPVLPSITPVFPGAEFEEREVYDLMGVTFAGHPDMRRILMPEGYEGHPLRKDFKAPPPPEIHATRWSNPEHPSRALPKEEREEEA